MLRIMKDRSGNDRWLSVSSSTFRDREEESVSKQAIDFSIADAGGDKGDLRLYHLPGTRVGACDFQFRAGDFLIEGGTFDDSELAKSAKSALKKDPDRWGVSIGFKYRREDLEDGIYKKIKIFERSILDESIAAALFTNIRAINWLEDTEMGKSVLQDLIDLAGGDEAKASELLKAAKGLGFNLEDGIEIGLKSGENADEDKAEEEVEEVSVKDTEDGGDIAEKQDAVGKDVAEEVVAKKEDVVAPKDFVLEIDDITIKALATAVAEQVTASLADLLPLRDAPLREDLKGIGKALNATAESLETLLKADSEKINDLQASLPRLKLGYRASEDKETKTDAPDDEAEKQIGSPGDILKMKLEESIAQINKARQAE